MKPLGRGFSMMSHRRRNLFSPYKQSLISLPKHVVRAIVCSLFHMGKFKPSDLNFMFKTMEFMLEKNIFLMYMGRSTKTILAGSGLP